MEKQRENQVVECQNCENYAFSSPEINGGIDPRILTVKDGNCNETNFFKMTLNICIVGLPECDEAQHGRGADVQKPHIKLSGQVATCAYPAPQFAEVIVYPKDGESVEDLYLNIVALCSVID